MAIRMLQREGRLAGRRGQVHWRHLRCRSAGQSGAGNISTAMASVGTGMWVDAVLCLLADVGMRHHGQSVVKKDSHKTASEVHLRRRRTLVVGVLVLHAEPRVAAIVALHEPRRHGAQHACTVGVFSIRTTALSVGTAGIGSEVGQHSLLHRRRNICKSKQKLQSASQNHRI